MAVAVAAAGLLCAHPVASAPDADRSQGGALSTILAAATTYVQGYETALRSVLATETFAQRNRVFKLPFGAAGGIVTTDTRRSLRSELFLTFVPPDEWIAVRNIAEIDGTPVVEHEDLAALLRETTPAVLARRLKDRNAGFNIGVDRNFNEPTFALRVLERHHVARFRFTLDSIGRRGPATLATIRYEERSQPTLVARLSDNQPIYASGELTIDTGSGVVRRTVMKLKDPTVSGQVTTVYDWNHNLEIWLPSQFLETWSIDRETVTGEASYSDWRRFEVKVTIR